MPGAGQWRTLRGGAGCVIDARRDRVRIRASFLVICGKDRPPDSELLEEPETF